MDGLTLRATRTERGLSQARFSELCNISQALLSSFELGKSSLSNRHLEAISAALADEDAVRRLSQRRKRYRRDVIPARTRESRASLAIRSAENPAYLDTLARMSLNTAAKLPNSPSVLSLFAGCGGMSLGLTAAGFQVKGFIEKDEGLRAIYSQNFSTAKPLGDDVSTVNLEDLCTWLDTAGPIDLIAGGPPCQGFSLAGKRDVDDVRNSLFNDYLRILEVVRPKAAILENVRLLTSMKDSDGNWVKDEIVRGFKRLGYKVRSFEANAKDFGVPQHRERVFFIAIRNDIGSEPSFPYATHGIGGDLFCPKTDHRTFADATSDLPFIESAGTTDDPLHCAVEHPQHVVNWLWDVPQGKSAHDNPNPADRPPSGYNTTYKRQVWDEPGGTVQTTFGMISGSRNVHPIATRSLTIREAARLQSFPDSYKFAGSLSTIRTGIGNAVPPLLAFAIGDCLLKLLR
jgi:DNA (cytosine-5)-methyltransferase 1